MKRLASLVFTVPLAAAGCASHYNSLGTLSAEGGAPATEGGAPAAEGGTPAAEGGTPAATQHVLLRKRGVVTEHPSVATSGAVLGVAFVTDGELTLGLGSADPNAALTFVTLSKAESGTDARPSLAGSDAAFDLVWTSGDATGSQRLMRARYDTAGNALEALTETATATSIDCNAVVGENALGIACAETSGDAGNPSVWARVCPRGGGCTAVEIGQGAMSRPAIVWDGADFDIVFLSTAEGLKLARVDASAQIVLRATVIDATATIDPAPTHYPYHPAAVVDGAGIAVAYGTVPTVAAFALSGVLEKGPWPLVAADQYHSGEVWYQIAKTPKGYAVLAGANSYPLDGYAGDTELFTVETAAPDKIASLVLAGAPYRAPYAAMTSAFGPLTTFFQLVGPALARVDIDPADLAAPPNPRFVNSPIGSLVPTSPYCNEGTCWVLGSEPAPALDRPLTRAGLYRVDLQSGQVTPPAVTATGEPPSGVAAGAIGAFGGALVLQPTHGTSVSSPPQQLIVLDLEGSSSQLDLPDAATTFYQRWFAEPAGLRLFSSPATTLSTLAHRLFAGGSFGAAASLGNVSLIAQCGTSYLGTQTRDNTYLDIVRIRPAEGSQPSLLTSLSLDEPPIFRTAYCSDGLLGLPTYDGQKYSMLLYTADGTHITDFELSAVPKGFASLGNDLLVVAADPTTGVPLAYEFAADSSMRTYPLPLPATAGSAFDIADLPWPGGDHLPAITGRTVRLTWVDSASGDTYLSSWQLP